MDPKQKIMDAAEQLFAEFGFDATSTRTIAAASDVNVAMISYYFGGKEQLLTQVFERKYAASYDSILEAQAMGVPALEKLYIIMERLVQSNVVNPCISRIASREGSVLQRPELRSQIFAFKKRNRDAISEIINAGIASGEFRQVDVALTVTLFYSATIQISAVPEVQAGLGYTTPEQVSNELKPRFIAFMKDVLGHMLLNR